MVERNGQDDILGSIMFIVDITLFILVLGGLIMIHEGGHFVAARLSGVKVEEESSYDLFDRSAVRAVNVSSPLPPLPAGFSGRWLGVHFEFEQTSG